MDFRMSFSMFKASSDSNEKCGLLELLEPSTHGVLDLTHLLCARFSLAELSHVIRPPPEFYAQGASQVPSERGGKEWRTRILHRSPLLTHVYTQLSHQISWTKPKFRDKITKRPIEAH